MTAKENLDPETESKVKKLKEKFVDKMSKSMFEDDHMFYRFLKVRNFNIEQAELMLKKHLEWRKENNIDNILKENTISEQLLPYVPHCYIGFDKECAPVKYFAHGRADTKGCLLSSKMKDFMRYVMQEMEREMKIIDDKSKEVGKNIPGSVHIVDMKDFSFAKATDKRVIQLVISILNCYQNNYPERLKCCFIINVSSYFTIAFAVIKTFISSDILNKMQIYSSEDEWKPALLDLIDADELPAFLGGNKTDPDGDPMCKSFVKHGGLVPSSLYIHKSKKSLSKSQDVKKITLMRASFSEIELEVEEPGSIIEWEFEIKSRDIGFGLFLKETDSKGEEKITELVPLLRLDTEEFSETGMYKCEKAGTHVILFDNSYSWVRSKELYYRATVVSPKQHESEMIS